MVFFLKKSCKKLNNYYIFSFFSGTIIVRFSDDQERPMNQYLVAIHYIQLLQAELDILNHDARLLFDLKIGRLKHQDIGQMQMYVNYYDRKVKLEDENPTIGILLCKDKNDAVVEMTLPEDNSQIFASKYLTVLPSKEELKKLMESEE